VPIVWNVHNMKNEDNFGTSTEKRVDPEEIALISTRSNTNIAHTLFNCPKLQCGCV